MKQLVLILLLVASVSAKAQQTNMPFSGNWIKAYVEFNDGGELSDQEAIKYSYLRYEFQKPDKAFYSLSYDSKGTKIGFYVKDNVLVLKNSFGYIMNQFLIEKHTEEEMILLQMTEGGFNSPDCIRFRFVPEYSYQKAIPLTANDILVINGKDTLFNASPKIFARFKGDQGFHEFLVPKIPAYQSVQSSNSYFLASFIVRKTGEVDSLQILEGINPDFDKQFIKAFNKGKTKWIPATINGNPVDVRMKEEFRFISSDTFLFSYDHAKKGKEAMREKEYLKALYFFEMALKRKPEDTAVLYQSAVCKLQLGNVPAACEDLKKIKALGSPSADKLLEEVCH